MPSYERELDLVQGYNFKKDIQKPIGFITSLTIGEAVILPDQTVSTPITNVAATASSTDADMTAGTLAVVSVLKKIKWDLGDTDPIEFEGTLSVNGKQLVMGLLYATMINIQVSVGYVIYEFDPINKKYFVAFSNTVSGAADATAGAGVSALVKKDGDNLALTVSPTPSSEVQSPENYDFTLQVVPLPVAQKLFLAAATTRRVTKFWGRQGPGGKLIG